MVPSPWFPMGGAPAARVYPSDMKSRKRAGEDSGAAEERPGLLEWLDHRSRFTGPAFLALGVLALGGALALPPGAEWVEAAPAGAPAQRYLVSVTTLHGLGAALLVALGGVATFLGAAAATLGRRHQAHGLAGAAALVALVALLATGSRVAGILDPGWRIVATRLEDGGESVHLELDRRRGAVALTRSAFRGPLTHTREFLVLNPVAALVPGGAVRLVQPAGRSRLLGRYVAATSDGWLVGVDQGGLARVAYHPLTRRALGESDIKELSAFCLLHAGDRPSREDLRAILDAIARGDPTPPCGASLREDAGHRDPRIAEAATRLLVASEAAYGPIAAP